jgi:hypothetical protein
LFLQTKQHKQKNDNQSTTQPININMKLKKFTSALVAGGLLSLAIAAQATTTNVIYLTGSTACRGVVYNAMTNVGQVFDSGHAGTVVSPGAGSGSQYICYEGVVSGTVVDIDCDWSGSEAGIAAVAGQGLTQKLNNSNPSIANGTYGLPNVPPAFLTQSSGYTTTALLSAIPGAPTTPDLTLADTSQAVSRTSEATYPLTPYGCVGVINFTFMKGYEAVKDSSWSNIVNVTTAQANQLITGPQVANMITGNTNDTDQVVVCGRNLGSGTRVNALLNIQHGVTVKVDQWAVDATYPGTNGVLTFGGTYTAGQGVQEVGNDGYDAGSSVQKTLNVDGSSNGYVMLGYVGLSDGANAYAGVTNTGAGPATYLPFNGVYESDSGVINGTYTFWGQENLYGTVGQSPSSQAGKVATAVYNGILAQETSAGYGTATGALGPGTPASQSIIIPTALMRVTRSEVDSGFPTQCAPGGF